MHTQMGPPQPKKPHERCELLPKSLLLLALPFPDLLQSLAAHTTSPTLHFSLITISSLHTFTLKTHNLYGDRPTDLKPTTAREDNLKRSPEWRSCGTYKGDSSISTKSKRKQGRVSLKIHLITFSYSLQAPQRNIPLISQPQSHHIEHRYLTLT